ncbi:hypothetical protein VHEMI02278 [[Torrubiella] hemipterigena]|uniref:Uncharacterized protein n=1 Tax=[Torrubiella] hemipterigena TaxID=1531966 RepID=A0A0A1TA32_9HYPO|nr:hypothetical protein VHEMI02278 [[Torrubiella] hemipterigena]
MATQRIKTTEKTILQQDDPIPEETRPTVPASVVVKLLAFTAAMIVLPIGSYFLTVNSLFNGNASYAGGLAAMIANVILISYVVVAMAEDQEGSASAPKKETKKNI